MNETYRFYNGLLDNEKFICSCDIDDLMGEPMVGDMIELPINADIGDQDLYIVKQRVVHDTCIEYFCKLYNWED